MMDNRLEVIGKFGIRLHIDPQNVAISILAYEKEWESDAKNPAYAVLQYDGKPVTVLLCEALDICTEFHKSGIGEGFRIKYSGWLHEGKRINASFDTFIWMDDTEPEIHFELYPTLEDGLDLARAVWPAPFQFPANQQDAYTVLPMMQGALIPSSWPEEVRPVAPWDRDIKFYERAAYMPWWGQVSSREGYIAIVETAWDAGYNLDHPAGGPTSIGALWYASMGRLSYRRTMRMRFLSDCDYNDLCMSYREYAKQQGLLVSLAQKVARNPKVKEIIGAPVVHTGIYHTISPKSVYYNAETPEKNEELTQFSVRATQLRQLKEKGLEKAYLHLDGWGKNGYDSMHPDVLPPCIKAGGAAGMRDLAKTCSDLGYLFAVHDQYRDYYQNAETYNENQSIVSADGTVHGETVWYGGPQNYLCQQLAPYYIRRNYAGLKSLGIEPDGAYLDVFAIISLEECYAPEHRMTRKESMEKRIECFRFIGAAGMLVSSEEPVDWAVPFLDLVHHAPYPIREVGSGPARGIPAPLFNLVYHDCLIVPWSLTKGGWGIPDGESGFLYALLNAGTGYLGIDANAEEINKIKVLLDLQQELAYCQMIHHEFLDASRKRQRAVYSNGTVVEIDLGEDSYCILNETKAEDKENFSA